MPKVLYFSKNRLYCNVIILDIERTEDECRNSTKRRPEDQYKTSPERFQQKKFTLTYNVVSNPNLLEIQNLSKKQCLGKNLWPEIDKVRAWMISSETATFMKWGGLGMVASELPEAFNACFGKDGHSLTVVTPLYLGDTGKKKPL